MTRKYVIVPEGGVACITPRTPPEVKGLCTGDLQTCCGIVVEVFASGDHGHPLLLSLCHADTSTELADKCHGIPGLQEEVSKMFSGTPVDLQITYCGKTPINDERRGIKTADYFGGCLRSIVARLPHIEGVNVLPVVYGDIGDHRAVTIERDTGRIAFSMDVEVVDAIKDPGVYYGINRITKAMEKVTRSERITPVLVYDGTHCLNVHEIGRLYGLSSRAEAVHGSSAAVPKPPDASP